MAKHKSDIPWWKLRSLLRKLTIEHQQLQRAYRDLEQLWSDAEQERIRLTEAYEPATGPSWSRDLRDVLRERREGRVRGEAETQMIPVIAVGIDPAAGTSPSGITVIRATEDGTAEVISESKRWGK